jgi:V8-like Glu-specific endopeptidase
VRFRSGRRARRQPGVRDTETAPAETGPARHRGPRRRAHRTPRIFRSPPRAGLITATAVGVLVTFTPASGAASDIATGFARVVRHLAAPSENGHPFSGTPAVGALFTTSSGQLGQHFCTASVVDSPAGDLVMTAAHCVTSASGTIDFVPGYDHGSAPYGVWTVTKVYVDQAWRSSASQDDDFAFLRVSDPRSSTPVEDETGADKLVTGTPAVHQLVQLIGYPNSESQPVTCQNWLREPMRDQLEFDCGGYTDGTSGGPFLSGVNPSTGQGLLIGVIGGYEQGGNTPQVSYSAVLGASAAALYKTAVADG